MTLHLYMEVETHPTYIELHHIHTQHICSFTQQRLMEPPMCQALGYADLCIYLPPSVYTAHLCLENTLNTGYLRGGIMVGLYFLLHIFPHRLIKDNAKA
jgi:hypothetical protein